MNKIKSFFKNDKSVAIVNITLVVALLVGFYLSVYQKFKYDKSLMYLQSDFLLIETSFTNFKTEIAEVLSDNSPEGVDYLSVVNRLDLLNSDALNNEEYIFKTTLSNEAFSQDLISYYNHLEYFIQNTTPKLEFDYYKDMVNESVILLSIDLNNTDNYMYMTEWIDNTIQDISSQRDDYLSSESRLHHLQEVDNLLLQYYTETINYLTGLKPLVLRAPEYISLNDRDKTRIIQTEIRNYSSQFIANEQNIAQMATDLFAPNIYNAITTLNDMDLLSTQIKETHF